MFSILHGVKIEHLVQIVIDTSYRTKNLQQKNKQSQPAQDTNKL